MFNNKYYLDTMFDDLFSNRELMKTDIYEEGDTYVFEIDLPGVKQDDIKLEIVNNYLSIEISKNNENEDKNKNYIKRERVYQNMRRQFYIGNVSDDEVKAKFNDGFLKIIVPREEKKKRQIEINLEK